MQLEPKWLRCGTRRGYTRSVGSRFSLALGFPTWRDTGRPPPRRPRGASHLSGEGGGRASDGLSAATRTSCPRGLLGAGRREDLCACPNRRPPSRGGDPENNACVESTPPPQTLPSCTSRGSSTRPRVRPLLRGQTLSKSPTRCLRQAPGRPADTGGARAAGKRSGGPGGRRGRPPSRR